MKGRGFRRLAGAMTSRRIPSGTSCGLARCGKPATHVLLSSSGRHYICAEHAPAAEAKGYEVFKGAEGCE